MVVGKVKKLQAYPVVKLKMSDIMLAPKFGQSNSKFYIFVQTALKNLEKVGIMTRGSARVKPILQGEDETNKDSFTSEDFIKDKLPF